ncbi:glycosyltransferase family 2 protein [Bacillus sp. REN3]|uniref:glycosyltransferase family 2 protein n=1 Tax=Bacillus sp. REN3 TaxID=2802440 RepID=UPI001AEDF700|nr:glycosyltransferase family 2 protein [Bacillus sp. REN3]
MNYLVGIGYKSRLDLLHRAVDSIEPYWPHTVIVDNSDGLDLRAEDSLSSKVTIFEPPVPLTFPQKINYLLEAAKERSCDALIFMHADAEAAHGVPEAFLKLIEEVRREEEKWGAIFTNYDSLCAINVEAAKAIGGHDTVFTMYFSDNDYYWRLHSAGYKMLQTDLPVIHHGSSSIKSDAYFEYITSITFPLYKSYLLDKWKIHQTEQLSYELVFRPSGFTGNQHGGGTT